jgi:hypothetical protein
MDMPIIGDTIRAVTDLIGKAIPDQDKKMEIGVQLATLADQADVRENQLLQGQIDVNKIEAASMNLFVSGWRPFIGWTGGVALGYTWVAAPFLKVYGHLTEMPALSADAIYPIIMAMLGIAGMRTYEKVKGVS